MRRLLVLSFVLGCGGRSKVEHIRYTCLDYAMGECEATDTACVESVNRLCREEVHAGRDVCVSMVIINGFGHARTTCAYVHAEDYCLNKSPCPDPDRFADASMKEVADE